MSKSFGKVTILKSKYLLIIIHFELFLLAQLSFDLNLKSIRLVYSYATATNVLDSSCLLSF